LAHQPLYPAVERGGGGAQDPEYGLDPEAAAKLLNERHGRRRVGSSSAAKSAGGFEDFVGTLEFCVLPPQLAQLLGLGGRGSVATLAEVGLVLPDPVPQHFGMHAQLLRQPLRQLPPPTTIQAQVTDLDIYRRQSLGGILNEYRHAA
jgi:hypothetical protein